MVCLKYMCVLSPIFSIIVSLTSLLRKKVTVKTDSIIGSLAKQLKDWMDCDAN